MRDYEQYLIESTIMDTKYKPGQKFFYTEKTKHFKDLGLDLEKGYYIELKRMEQIPKDQVIERYKEYSNEYSRSEIVLSPKIKENIKSRKFDSDYIFSVFDVYNPENNTYRDTVVLLGFENDNFGQNFNNIDPSSSVPSGEDWEALISVAYNSLEKGVVINTDFDDPDWARASKYWSRYSGQSLKVANTLRSKLKKYLTSGAPLVTLNKLGGGNGATSQWEEWCGQRPDNTPKTDILTSNKIFKLSLKKSGGSQLLSGMAGETKATFHAALNNYGNKNAKEVNQLIKDISDKMGKMSVSYETSRIKDMMFKIAGETTKNQKNDKIFDLYDKIKDKLGDPSLEKEKKIIDEYIILTKNAEELTKKYNEIFQSEDFKKFFVFEAASGQQKFGDTSLSRATSIMEFDPDKQIINFIMPIVTPNDASDLAKKVNINCSFKKSGGGTPPYLSTRGILTSKASKELEVIFKQEYMSESVTKIEIPTYRTIISEALKDSEYGKKILSESVEKDPEIVFNNMLKTLHEGSSLFLDKISDIVTNVVNSVKTAMNFLFQMGGKALKALLDFFGMEIESVSYTGVNLYI